MKTRSGMLSLAVIAGTVLLLLWYSDRPGDAPNKAVPNSETYSPPTVSSLVAGYEARANVAPPTGSIRPESQSNAGSVAQARLAEDQWTASYERTKVSPSTMFLYAPLAATPGKLLRNVHLNPRDERLTQDQVAYVQAIVDQYTAEIRDIEQAKGAVRMSELRKQLDGGQLTPLSSHISSLTRDDQARIEAAAARLPEGQARAAQVRDMQKTALMNRLGIEAALTTPSGEVYFPRSGSITAHLSDYNDFQMYLQDEFFGKIVEFFRSQGFISDVGSQALVSQYFSKRR